MVWTFEFMCFLVASLISFIYPYKFDGDKEKEFILDRFLTEQDKSLKVLSKPNWPLFSSSLLESPYFFVILHVVCLLGVYVFSTKFRFSAKLLIFYIQSFMFATATLYGLICIFISDITEYPFILGSKSMLICKNQSEDKKYEDQYIVLPYKGHTANSQMSRLIIYQIKKEDL